MLKTASPGCSSSIFPRHFSHLILLLSLAPCLLKQHQHHQSSINNKLFPFYSPVNKQIFWAPTTTTNVFSFFSFLYYQQIIPWRQDLFSEGAWTYFFPALYPTKESGDFVVHLPAEWWGQEGERSPLSSREPLLKSTNHSIVVAQLALLSCQCERRGHRDEWHTGWSQHLANHVGTLYQDSIITLGQLNLDKTYRLRTKRGKDSMQPFGQKCRLLKSAMGTDQFLSKLSPVKDLCNTTQK